MGITGTALRFVNLNPAPTGGTFDPYSSARSGNLLTRDGRVVLVGKGAELDIGGGADPTTGETGAFVHAGILTFSNASISGGDGPPSGVVGGTTGQCYVNSTTDGTPLTWLYRCTSSGDALTATWTGAI